MTPHTSLTLIVEGKPLVFDNPVPVGEVIPAGVPFAWDGGHEDRWDIRPNGVDWDIDQTFRENGCYFTARPPVAPESFADGDVAWVRVERSSDFAGGLPGWSDPDRIRAAVDADLERWLASGDAYLLPSPRPKSLADVLDDANLPDELRARIEKAVGGA